MEGRTPWRPDGKSATCIPLVLDTSTGCNYGRIYVDLSPVLCLACQQWGLLHLGHLQHQNRTLSMLQLGPTKCVNSVMFWNLIRILLALDHTLSNQWLPWTAPKLPLFLCINFGTGHFNFFIPSDGVAGVASSFSSSSSSVTDTLLLNTAWDWHAVQ